MILGRSVESTQGVGVVDRAIEIPVGSEVVYTVRGRLPEGAALDNSARLILSPDQIDLWPDSNALHHPRLRSDLDRNGKVDFADFLILSGNFGKEVTSEEEGDLNADNRVGFADFLILSSEFGKSGRTSS